MTTGLTDHDTILVRRLHADDLSALIALDARLTGRRREAFFTTKLRRTLEDTGIAMSLAAELDGLFAGYLLARVWYGEFGALESTAVLDGLGVHPGLRGRGVAQALLRQLRANLAGIGIGRLQTEVDWNEQELLAFFHHEGFRPAPRFCLDLALGPAG